MRALERAWKGIRAVQPAIPEAVLVLIRQRGTIGQFSQSRWRVLDNQAHEIALSPALLSEPIAVLQTLLHEATHASLWPEQEGGIRSQYYHLKTFRNQARHFGLRCEFQNTRYGWADTGWPNNKVPQPYDHVLYTLARDLQDLSCGMVATHKVVARKLPSSGLTRLVCKCNLPRVVYVSKSVLAGAPVVCGACGKRFVPARRPA